MTDTPRKGVGPDGTFASLIKTKPSDRDARRSQNRKEHYAATITAKVEAYKARADLDTISELIEGLMGAPDDADTVALVDRVGLKALLNADMASDRIAELIPHAQDKDLNALKEIEKTGFRLGAIVIAARMSRAKTPEDDEVREEVTDWVQALEAEGMRVTWADGSVDGDE